MFRKQISVCLLTFMLLLAVSAGAQSESDNVSALVNGNNNFAFDLYQQIRADAEGNLLYSPYSVSQALAMTYLGARGSTEAQMADVLYFALPQSVLHPTFGLLNAGMLERANAEPDENYGTPGYQLNIANALWGEQTYPFRADYISASADNYGAGLRLVDFIGNPEGARAEVNDWAAEQTNDRIQNILPEGIISPQTRLVLANAVYFNNAWATQFNEDSTQDAPFFLLDNSTVPVAMMQQADRFRYTSGDGYQAVELPYYGDMSMVILLPEQAAFVDFEAGLDAAGFDAIINNLRYAELRLFVPRFEFESSLDLSQTLINMGMTAAFDPAAADFSGMADIPTGENLFLSAALHKAFIRVDEFGTEAAAVTVIIAGETSAMPDPQEPIEFRADRPFIFAIRDTQSGSVLFLGRVLNPAE